MLKNDVLVLKNGRLFCNWRFPADTVVVMEGDEVATFCNKIDEFCNKPMNFAIKSMNFAIKPMNFAIKSMNFVVNMMDCVLKMMNFEFQMMISTQNDDDLSIAGMYININLMFFTRPRPCASVLTAS